MDVQMKKSVFFGTQKFITSENPTCAEPVMYSCGKKLFFAEGT